MPTYTHLGRVTHHIAGYWFKDRVHATLVYDGYCINQWVMPVFTKQCADTLTQYLNAYMFRRQKQCAPQEEQPPTTT